MSKIISQYMLILISSSSVRFVSSQSFSKCLEQRGSCACMTDKGLLDLSALDFKDASKPRYGTVYSQSSNFHSSPFLIISLIFVSLPSDAQGVGTTPLVFPFNFSIIQSAKIVLLYLLLWIRNTFDICGIILKLNVTYAMTSNKKAHANIL